MAKYVKTEQGYQEVEAINSNKMDRDNPVGTGSFSMGRKFGTVVGTNSHAEGGDTTASGDYSHAEGNNTTASNEYSHAEGSNTTASGNSSHTEGVGTAASGNYSHAEGLHTTASGNYSHAEGSNTTASAYGSHAEGGNTTASNDYSHAEGLHTTASGNYSHAEGSNTTAIGYNAHAEGNETTASGYSSHAEGLHTIAKSSNQHVQGKYNVGDSQGKYAHIVGNGTSNSNYSNAHTLDWNGVPWFNGRPQFGGTAQDQGSQTVMANGDKEIILTSTTTDSTKKFKITVDDDYNVSATNTSDSVSKTLATTEYVDNSVSKSNPLNITGATVGQIAKITAVDNTGKPTAWEAVDMPSGGGGDSWELIYYGEITEDIGSIIVDKDSNGNAFSLKEYKLVITTVAAAENPNSGFSWYTHNDDGGTKGPFYTISGAVGGRTLVFDGKLCGNCWWCQYITDTGNTAAQGSRSVLCPDGQDGGPSAVPVYKLKLAANSGNTCGAGSKVALFGVRA